MNSFIDGAFMKKIIIANFIIALLLTLSFNVKANEYNIVFASFFGNDHPNTKMLLKFKDKVETYSRRKFKVSIKANSELGGEEEIMDLVKKGEIQMALIGGLVKYDEPMLASFEQPFIIKDWDHARRVFLSKNIKQFEGDYSTKSGAIIKGIIVNGFRQISSSFKIDSLQDLQGVKMRTPFNDIFIQLFKALGTKPIPIPATEVYKSFENKIIDCQDNPFTLTNSMKWYEFNPYILETKHIFSPSFILVNKDWYEQLKGDNRKLFNQAIKEAVEYNWEMAEQEEHDSMNILKNKGVTIYPVSDSLKNEINKAIEPVYLWFDKEVPNAKEFRDYCQKLE